MEEREGFVELTPRPRNEEELSAALVALRSMGLLRDWILVSEKGKVSSLTLIGVKLPKELLEDMLSGLGNPKLKLVGSDVEVSFR